MVRLSNVNGGNGMSMASDINRYKRQLITRYSKAGIYENFGQKEVRKLTDKYGIDYTFRRTTQPIDDFNNWCMNFTGR
jgi:hypothetical protein